MFIVEPSVELISFNNFPLETLEKAGRTAYKSEDKIGSDTAKKFIEKLLALGHESVFEHVSVSFRIICDRGVSHELVRHRLASYTQESTRYCNYAVKGRISVIEPPDLGQARDFWVKAVNQAETAYLNLIQAGCRPEIARSVLPTCLKTEIVMTANLREWRHFVKLRTSTKAHPQMRTIAIKILGDLMGYCPELFREFQITATFPGVK